MVAATASVRRILSKDSKPPVEPVLAAGAGPVLVSLLAHTNPKIVFEAAWSITNVASTEHTARVVEMGAIGPLVKLLRSAHENVREQVIWCLGNVVGDGPAYRDMLLDTPDCVPALVLNIQNPANVSLLRNATWALSNFCRGKPKADPAKLGSIIGVLTGLLRSTDKDVLADALWGLSYLTDGSSHYSGQLVGTEGALARLIECMSHERGGVVIPALRTIGNIVCGTDDQTEAVIDAGCLGPLSGLIGNDKRNIRREACWAASNIAAGTKSQIARLVHTPRLMANVQVQASTAEWYVRREAAWVVSNVANSGKAIDVAAMVDGGVFECIVDLLKTREPKASALMLDALCDIFGKGDSLGRLDAWLDAFEAAGGQDTVDELQSHESPKVYEACVRLIEAYLSDGDDDEEDEGVDGGEAFHGSTALVPASGAANPFSVETGAFGDAASAFNTPAAGAAKAAANPFAAAAPGGFGASGFGAAPAAPVAGGFNFAAASFQ